MEITKLQISPYALTPKLAPNRLTSAKPRDGVLLRVFFEGLHLPGHADLFPWVELGDLPLGLQLETLKERTPLPLAAASVLWAFEEAKARAKKEAFFPGTDIESHATLVERSLPQSVPFAKLKISDVDAQDWGPVEAFMRQHPLTKFRLDFNGLFDDFDLADLFWSKVSDDIKAQIDFLEDPFCDDLMGDPDVHEVFTDAMIAVDRSRAPDAIANAHIRVLKPITFAPDFLLSEAMDFRGKLVVTSSMDHPLGQLIALRGAQLIQKSCPEKMLAAGLLTHSLYEIHQASDWVHTKGRCLQAKPTGLPGWGLQRELDALVWTDL